MDTTIRSLTALKQCLNFKPIYPVTKRTMDIDLAGRLTNNSGFACEVKKDLEPEHNPKMIINSDKWDDLRFFFKESMYLIYATHSKEISEELIDTDTLIVRYIEQYGKEIPKLVGLPLLKCLNKISSIGVYYITVKYPNKKDEEFALHTPDEIGKWTSLVYWSGKNAFLTEASCIEYIKKRYEQEFNRPYIYSIHYAESMSSAKVIHRYTYEETIGL